MEIYNGILVVDLHDLTRDDDGQAVMSKCTYHNLQKRHRLNVLIEYASLPELYKKKFEAKYGDPVRSQINEKVKYHFDQKARDWYYDDLNGIPTKLAEQYTINASVLKQLSQKMGRMTQLRKVGGSGTALKRDEILAESEHLRAECGHTLPRSVRLFELIRRFNKEGYSCLVSGKLGNGNSRSITKEMGRMIFALKRSMDPVYSIDEIRQKVNEAAVSHGWREIKSNDTIIGYLERNKARWLDAEQGDTRAKM